MGTRESQTAGQGGHRYAHIEGLRAWAVAPVLYTHFWDERSPLGSYGVLLFFVISGYLITGILLRTRNDPAYAFGPAIISFYVRRSMRLWPAFYIFILIALVANPDHFRESAAWHALFLSNFYFILHHTWHPWVASHVWTLAIEQQFYVVWPFLILLTPRRWLLPAIIATILMAGLFRAGVLLFSKNDMMLIATPSAFDALGFGALFAWLNQRQGLRFRVSGTLRNLAVVGGAALAVGVNYLPLPLPLFLVYTLGWSLALVMLAIVVGAQDDFTGVLGLLVNNRLVRWLGQISYGIYLYHLLIWAIWFEWSERFGIWFPGRGPLGFVLGSALAIAAAALSWYCVENPISRRKSLFPYAAGR